MKKFILMLAISLGGIFSAQAQNETFNFACESERFSAHDSVNEGLSIEQEAYLTSVGFLRGTLSDGTTLVLRRDNVTIGYRAVGYVNDGGTGAARGLFRVLRRVDASREYYVDAEALLASFPLVSDGNFTDSGIFLLASGGFTSGQDNYYTDGGIWNIQYNSGLTLEFHLYDDAGDFDTEYSTLVAALEAYDQQTAGQGTE